VGRNYVGYGESQNENFVWLLENFANDSPPTRPITGQLWYNSATQSLKLYDGVEWKTAASADVTDTQPTGTPGSLWFKSDSNQLFVYNDQWVLVGPEAIAGFGETKVVGIAINDDSTIPRPALEIKVDDIVIGTITKAAFTIGSPAIPGFLNLTNGITLAEGYNFKGNLIGNAASASSLVQGKTINGIVFDGTQNVTIRAATTQPLIRGTYLKGNNFDGTIARTWEVDASVEPSPGKIVARDANGGTILHHLLVEQVVNTDYLNANHLNVAGDITAGQITASEFIGASLSGNALTATRLQIPRNINGVEFSGTQDITIPFFAEHLLGMTLPENVTVSNIRSLGRLVSLEVDGPISMAGGDTTINNEFDTLAIKTTNTGGITITFPDPSSPFSQKARLEFFPGTGGNLGFDYEVASMYCASDFDIGQSTKPIRKVFARNAISNQVDTDFIRAKTTSGTITIGDTTIINGDLIVNGVTTTVNSNAVDISDVNITLAKGAANQVAADGGGITVEGANALFYYSATGNKWNINKRLDAGDNDIITTGYFRGTATAAQYADLAENYLADQSYAPGTVLEFGGTEEVTLAQDETRRVAGVVSTNPAYLMNSECQGIHVVAIALQGRVPCKVRGKIRKGDMLTSGGAGYARPTIDPKLGTIIGKALEDFGGIEGVIEVAVGRL
jgi:hypothetical protein